MVHTVKGNLATQNHPLHGAPHHDSHHVFACVSNLFCGHVADGGHGNGPVLRTTWNCVVEQEHRHIERQFLDIRYAGVVGPGQ